MDFRVDDDQRALAEGVRSVLQGRFPSSSCAPAKAMRWPSAPRTGTCPAPAGVFALTLPEPAGDRSRPGRRRVVFEELGRGLVPGPLVGTFLAAAPGWCPVRPRARVAGGRALVPARRAPSSSSTWARSTRCSSSALATTRPGLVAPAPSAGHSGRRPRSTR